MQFYERAITPIEAPEKKDYGDIDILVDHELSGFNSGNLAGILSAKLSLRAGRTSSFAIPLPGISDAYFQLDIRLCRKDHFEWETMIHSYGDLCHIVGATVTRFGLAINDTGLHLRIAEIDMTHKKDALLFLTHNPREIMDFLGLDAHTLENGFKTLDEVFKWAASSRLFRKRFFVKDVISEKEERVRDKRPMYCEFVTEWIPHKSEPEFARSAFYEDVESTTRDMRR